MKTLIKNSNRKSTILAILFFVVLGAILFFFQSCTKEYNIEIESESNDSIIVVYQHDNIRVESIESDSTANCPNGEIHLTVYRNDTIISETSYCKEDSLSGEICPDYWDYLSFEGGCDTIYNLDCHGILKFKIPICPEIVILPGDTVFVCDTIFIDGDSYISLSFIENFDKGNSFYYDTVLNWTVLGTGASINHNGARIIDGKKSGTVEVYDTSKAQVIVWSPEFVENLPLYYADFFTGSAESLGVYQIWVKYENGDSSAIASEYFGPTAGFQWDDPSSYPTGRRISYLETNLKNAKKISRIGIGFIWAGKPSNLQRNSLPNIENLSYILYKKIS